MKAARLLGGILVGLGASAATAGAEEAKTPISAALLLHMLAPAAESRQAAFDLSLREPGPRPLGTEGEVLPDGSVRYGDLTVTVRNPCPPGTPHYERPALPGRRALN